MCRSLVIIVVTGLFTIVGTLYFAGTLFCPGFRAVYRDIKPVGAMPHWIGPTSCTAMNDEERKQDRLALQVLRDFPVISAMHIGAVRHFGRDRYRHQDHESFLLCPSRDLNGEIASLSLAQQMFSGSYLHAYPLRLARHVGPRDPAIVEVVARTAFHEYPILTEYPEFKEDIRSLARVTLAEFGAAAAPWSAQAYKAMNAQDRLGTTAAQIAVVTGHPQALQQVSQMLDTILRDNPKDPIRRDVRDRFYDLAYALASVGAKARDYVGPVIRIMSREVQSAAPPFGLIELKPRRMCRVLELIGGPDADRARASETCHPKIDVFEK
jgi:hypothetical protein